MHQIDVAPQISSQHVARQTYLRRSALVFLTGTCLSLPNTTFAQPKRYQVELTAAKNLPACDRAIDFSGMLANLLAKPLLDTPASRILIVQIGKTPTDDYRVDLAGNEADGSTVWATHHEFPAETSCFDVLYKAALRASIAMENQASLEESPVSNAPPAQERSTSPATLPKCPTSEPWKSEPPKSKPWGRHLFVGAGALVGFGITPDVAVGMQLFAGWQWSPAWSFEAHARATLPDDTRPLETVSQVATWVRPDIPRRVKTRRYTRQSPSLPFGTGVVLIRQIHRDLPSI